MMWKALGQIGEGWVGAKSCICKDLEQGIRFSAVYGKCSDGVLPGSVGFKRRDLRGVLFVSFGPASKVPKLTHYGVV